MSPLLTFLADLLVAVLLTATILSSVRLSRRIARLKADETAMRQTIGELMVATETAERAIAGLRTTLGDCDRTLAERLRTAERYAADLAQQVEAGQSLMSRISQIVDSSRQIAAVERRPEPVAPKPAASADRISAAMAAAQAVAERATRRLESSPA